MAVQVQEIGEGGALVRNTVRPGEVIALARTEWEAFLAAVKDGSFDDLSDGPVTAEVEE